MMTDSPLPRGLEILLADDDSDDRLLFKEALEELKVNTTLTYVNDGDQLMRLLTKNSDVQFDVLFLDLNMPRKNGYVCLEEIKKNDKLKSIPVIIFSTSYDPLAADLLYKNGARHYICKPHDFSGLRRVVQTTLTLVSEKSVLKPVRENFFIEV